MPKQIRIDLKNGLELRIPVVNIQRIVLPDVIINNNYHRLVLDEDKILPPGTVKRLLG